ncbi:MULTISPECIES: adenylosuccinate synthase [Synergistaceae]|uniref:adenylosuccinate synthase n=1 Tax=Synergistaceae TaxID=649777 RepID=UPI003AD9B4DD|nr:adenylosuccinate synthase [Synergistaceae bacterium DZ-S4]
MKGRTDVIVGVQWGDEGKGRVVDALAGRSGVVVRYQGGANAGHTVVVGDEKFVFHLLPSGILYPGKLCVIGNGVVIDPETLFKELDDLKKRGKPLARLVISHGAHVVMPYHKLLDRLAEGARSEGSRIGTTGRGIGPCYSDKFGRVGIRAEDLVNPGILKEKLMMNIEQKNEILTKIYGAGPLESDTVYQAALEWGRRMEPMLGDAFLEIHNALETGINVLFEGAQGTLLDVDHGTYPFVTSSSPCSGGACTGAGIGPGRIDRVIGVTKAYCTRVGEGPFPTEDKGSLGELLRTKGGEFGATTGRPRRCGWNDLVAVDYAVKVNGIDGLALTKLDVLSGFEKISVCTAYEIDGKVRKIFPSSCAELAKAKPVFEELPGWKEDIGGCRRFEDLPLAAQDYIRFIEERVSAPVILIGVGQGREDTILRGI